MVSNNLDDAFKGDGFAFEFDVVAHVCENLLRSFYSDGHMHQGGICYNFVVGAFDFTYVGGDVGCQQGDDIGRQGDIIRCCLGTQDGHTCFQVRCLDISCQSLVKTGTQAVFQRFNFAGGTVTGDDDLFIGILQCIKCMEEFYLCLLLALQKLDIVDNQAVDIAVFLTEGFRGFVLNRVDDFVGEFFTGGVQYLHAGIILLDAVADSVH